MPRLLRSTAIRGRRESRGFALIVVLSLMILLTVIAVGLLTISSVALRTSNKEFELNAARANARLGMMLALNQLQSALGPDQRVTAPADLENPAAASTKWVGVYGNEADADYSQTPSGIPNQPYKPALLNWLVSGNETVSFASSEASGSFGKITKTPSSIPYKPTDAVSNEGSPAIRNQQAALLVSGGSISSANSRSDSVVAPVVPVLDNYRIQEAAVESDAGKSYSFVTSRRSGIEMMRSDSNKDSWIGSDYDPAASGLEKVSTIGQLALASPNLEVAAFVQDDPPVISEKNSRRSMRVAAFGPQLDGGQLDSLFYDNGGDKQELYAGHNSLSSSMSMPRGETMALYKQVEQAVEGSSTTRTAYLHVGGVDMAKASKAIIVLIVPVDPTKEKIKGRAFKDSYTIHPAETARVFNLSTKTVAIRAGKEALQLSVGETGVMPWKAVAFNSVACQIGIPGEKEGTWDLVESAECAARADMRTFAFVSEVEVDSKRTVTATTVFDPLPDEVDGQ